MSRPRDRGGPQPFPLTTRSWGELTNTSRRTVDLDGWTLSNEDGDTSTFDHYRLEGRVTVRIHTGRGHDPTPTSTWTTTTRCGTTTPTPPPCATTTTASSTTNPGAATTAGATTGVATTH
jgi:hypothetical protein